MVEPLADGFEGRLDLAEIPKPTRPRIGLTAKCNLRIERMAVQARIFRSALPQPVRCVEDEFLREFDHVRRVAGVFGAVKRVPAALENAARSAKISFRTFDTREPCGICCFPGTGTRNGRHPPFGRALAACRARKGSPGNFWTPSVNPQPRS